MIVRLLITFGSLVAMNAPAFAYGNYPQAQYNPPSFYSPGGNSSPVVVPPTVIMPGDVNSSKKSCKENVIDFFLISWKTRSGDCTE